MSKEELVREVAEHYKQHKFSSKLIRHISTALICQDKKDYMVFKSVKDVILQAKRKNAQFVSVFGHEHESGKVGAVFSKSRENAQEEFQGKKVWIALKDSTTCNFCKELDGQTVGIDEEFVAKGQTKAGMKTYFFDAPPAHFVLKGENAGTPTCRCIAVLS